MKLYYIDIESSKSIYKLLKTVKLHRQSIVKNQSSEIVLQS